MLTFSSRVLLAIVRAVTWKDTPSTQKLSPASTAAELHSLPATSLWHPKRPESGCVRVVCQMVSCSAGSA